MGEDLRQPPLVERKKAKRAMSPYRSGEAASTG